jgi:hypothetical protein
MPKQISGTVGGETPAQTQARAALVAMEGREPEASRNIRAIGKDPDEIPDAVKQLDVVSLYAPGMRTERRQILLRHAVEYLFNVPIMDETGQDRVIARLGARTKLMVDWKIGAWEKYLRPKTWMDSLDVEKQAKWAEAKRRYDRKVELENAKLAKARAEYDKVVSNVTYELASAREGLKNILREFGVKEAPLLTEEPESVGLDRLKQELGNLGVNFRPPDFQSC